MRFTSRQLRLVLAALLLSVLMSAVVPIVTDTSRPLVGYVSVLAIYWVCFCIPVSVVFGSGVTRVAFSLRAGRPWIPAVALTLPVIVFFAAKPTSWIGSDPGILVLAVICAVINGPLEELAWRRTFRANSANSLSYELLGLGLFTLWHVPLCFSKGVAFDHGAVGLVGGALLLGAVWALMTRQSDSIAWPMVSHVLVNVSAFLAFFAVNFAR